MMLKFYTDTDKLFISKKRVLVKAAFFYIIAQSSVFVLLLLFFSVLVALGIDPKMFRSTIQPDFVFNKWYLVIFIGPMIEELAFRLGISFRKKDVAISLALLSYVLLNIVWGDYTNRIFLRLLIALLLLTVLLNVSQKFWNNLAINFGKQIIVFMVLFFGFLHLMNFNMSFNYLFVYLFLCSPQIIMGITFSYLRLNAGFIYALIAHILVNSISVMSQLI